MIKELLGSWMAASPMMTTVVRKTVSECTLNGQVVDCSTAWSTVSPYFGITLGFIIVLLLAVWILTIVSQWIIFTKAGEPGWKSIIPIYNIFVLMKIIKEPFWWAILLFIPIVNIIISVMVSYRLSLSFGKDIGFAIGLFFLTPIFYAILAFDKSTYRSLDETGIAATYI